MMPKLAKLCDNAFSNFKLSCKSSCCTMTIEQEHEHEHEKQQPPKPDDNNQPPLKLKDIFTEQKEDTEPAPESKQDQ